jgi:aspartyl-tRNA(Asn)/glutamyl-tRNA(Gln) amidotransferase subunit C
MSEEESFDIDHLCRLARIRVDEEYKASFGKGVKDILSWVGCLGEVETEGVEALTSVAFHAEEGRMREDEVNDGGDAERVLSNAPSRLMDFYVVPKVVE